MKLPRIYTERVELYTFWRGARCDGTDGPPHNLGAVGVVSYEQACKAYIRKLKLAMNQRFPPATFLKTRRMRRPR